MAKYKLTQKTDANGTTQDIVLDASCVDGVVKSVNGTSPDANGNVNVSGGGDLSNYVDKTSAQTISGAKTLSTDLTFDASVQTQLIYKTGGTTSGLIRSGILSNSEKYMVQQADKFYFANNSNTNRIIYSPTANPPIFAPENADTNIGLGSDTLRWKSAYIGSSGITSNGDIRATQSVPNFSGFMSGDEYNVSPIGTQSAQYLARDKNGNWMGGTRIYHTPPTRDSNNNITDANAEKTQTQLIARSPKTSTYSSSVMLEQDISATANNQAGKCRFRPADNSTIDLGAYGNRWRNLFTGGGIYDYGALSSRGVDASSNYSGYFLVAYTTHTSCYTQALAEILAQDWDTMGGWYNFRVNGYFGVTNNVKVLNGQIGCTETGQGLYSAVSFGSGHLYLVCRTTSTSGSTGTNRLEIWYKADATYSRQHFYFKEDIGLASRSDALTHWTKVKVASATDQGYVQAGNIVYLDTAHDFPTFIPTSSWGVSAFQTTNYPTAEIKNNNLANDMRGYVGRFNSLTNYTNTLQYTLPSKTGTLRLNSSLVATASATAVSYSTLCPTVARTYLLVPYMATMQCFNSSNQTVLTTSTPLIAKRYSGDTSITISGFGNSATAFVSGITKISYCKSYDYNDDWNNL